MPLDRCADYHMHSAYSDGTASVDEIAQSAIQKGLTTIAVTDHMPLPFPTRYAMERELLEDYRREIETARRVHGRNITILAGLEIEYIPRHRHWIKEIIDQGWDILLVSVHGIVTDRGHFMVNGRKDEFERTFKEVFQSDIRAFCSHYYQLIREAAATGWFDVAGHLDVIKKHNQNNRYFDETAAWYRKLVRETLEALAANGMKLEINTNGINHRHGATYPSPWIIREADSLAIPLVLGSDAHTPERQGQYFNKIPDISG
ncbi:MAG: histidinol-phosphatase [Desulfobacterales bacterium]|nr:histidinol-phosphatase [Desulfobacterales bacterium]